MDTGLSAFQACFTDWRLIKGRKQIQLVFEIPLEAGDLAYKALGGMPDPGQSVWCAIARLQQQKGGDAKSVLQSTQSVDKSPRPQSPQPPDKAGGAKSWHTLSPAAQTGILRNEMKFQKFLQDEFDSIWLALLKDGTDVECAVAFIHWRCGVNSCSEIKRGEESGDAWNDLVSQFRAWERIPEVVG